MLKHDEKNNKIKQSGIFVPPAGKLSHQVLVKINIMFKNYYAWENKSYQTMALL